MIYDKESFMKGLITGMRLGRANGKNTGLGWAADSEYLIYFANTELVRYGGGSSRTPYTKQENGYAVCCIVKNLGPVYGQYWTGPLLLSTNLDFVRYFVGGTPSLEENTISYLGLTFYLNRDAWNCPLYSGGDQIPISSFPIFDANGYSVTSDDMSSVAFAIMREAHVHKTEHNIIS